jgi:hypothetical protein
MDEKKILKAIAKDFKISKSKVRREVNPTAKTTSLTLHLPRLIEVGGLADIVYVLGYKSKKLVQVNIDWGAGVTNKFDQQDLIHASILLQRHFVKKRYIKDGYMLNGKLKNGTIIVFRGRDKKGRLILFRLRKQKNNRKEARKNNSLILSYILDLENPDVLKAKFN